MSRILATIQGEDIVEHDDGSVTYTSTAHVDDDGSGGNPWHDPDFQPHTSLKHRDGSSLNAETEAYIVVPPAVVHDVPGVVLGCKAAVEYGDLVAAAVVGDVGPAKKLGELSPACARLIGANPSSVSGGVDTQVVKYTIWPGVPAPGYVLQPS